MQSRSGIGTSFHWLNISQFLGALNDNVFKLLVVFFLAHQLQADREQQATIMAIASTAFVLPFLLFSHAAGVLADRHSKRDVLVYSKAAEVVIVLLGLAAIVLGDRLPPSVLYGLVFIICAQAAFYGPAKYGIVPELVNPESLSAANSYLVGSTYLAIIIGTFVPSLVLQFLWPGSYVGLAVICVAVAAVGWWSSLRVERTRPVGTTRKMLEFFPADIYRTVRDLRSDRDLLLAVLGSSYFLYLGAFIQMDLVLYGEAALNLNMEKSGFLFPLAAVGIGIGALVAGRMSGRNIEFGLVPIGAAGLTLCCIGLRFAGPVLAVVSVLILMTGFFSGLFTVPLNAFIQYRTPAGRRGEILACQNFLSFLGVAAAAGTVWLMANVFHLSPLDGFLVVGVLTLVLAVAAVVVLPDFLVRFVMLVLTRIFYRIRVEGLHHVPSEGAALLVANHVTWVDFLLIGATQQRRVRFVMARQIYEIRWIRPLCRLMGVIPVSPADSPRRILESLAQARHALDEGFLVCIFAEGTITRNGNMRQFHKGLERIVAGSTYPVVPVCIAGAWGSIFSYHHGRLFAGLPKAVPYPVSVWFGDPMPATVTARQVERAVSELMGRSFDQRKSTARTLSRMFIRTARRNWFRHAVSDTSGLRLSFGRLLTAAVAFALRVEASLAGQQMVGILIPTSAAGMIANIAVTLSGRVAVNLNYTTSAETIDSVIRQCGIRTVITSRAFLEKLGNPAVGATLIHAEDVLGNPGGAKWRALLMAALSPARFLERYAPANSDSVATVIFSSGSTGEPKGVMLSHHNIISNVESFTMVCRFTRNDNLCAVLPLFHSFGFTCGFWGPMILGFPLSCHPNPLDGGRVAQMIRENGVTVMMTTPTFLLAYARRAVKEDFATLRLVIAGAEKLRKQVADIFEEKTGIRPLEGYGATEMSPVVALSIPDVLIDRVRHEGTREGSVGHVVPGVTARVVHPDTREPLGDGQEGLLHVKGPNRMLGYLGNPDATAAVICDGWYETGDVARIDSDGFVFLLDRISRYSKIGGEMVPHIAVEERILQGLQTGERVVAVAAAPDEKKGEQLVVFFTSQAGDADRIHGIVSASDLPNLWRPKRENYVLIDAMPTLGSGKLDLRTLKAMARAHTEKSGSL